MQCIAVRVYDTWLVYVVQEGGGKKSYEAGRRGDKYHAKERVTRAEQPPPPPHVPSAEAGES